MANYRKSFNLRNGVQVDDDNFIVNTNGLVGIGTSIPTEFLDVRGNAKVVGLVTASRISTPNLTVSGVTTSTSFTDGKLIINSGIITSLVGIVTYYGDGSGLINIPTSQWIDVNTGTGVTSIYSAGRVGISTNYPYYDLQIGADPNTFSGIGINSTGNIKASGIITANSFSGSGAGITSINASNITTGTLSNSLLPSNINISGIITASNGFIGNVSGNVTGNLTGIASTANTITSTANIRISSINTGFSTSGISTINTLLHVLGNVGVGTLTPNAQIHLRKSGISSLQLTSDGTNQSIITFGRSVNLTSNNAQLRFGNTNVSFPESTEQSLDIINYDTGNINFYLNPGGAGTGSFNWFKPSLGKIMTLTSSGNLGINSDSPTSRLSVSGNVQVSGTATIGTNLVVNGNSTFNQTIFNNNVGILTSSPSYNFQVGRNPTTSSGVGISSSGTITASSTIIAQNLNVSGVVTATNGFMSDAGGSPVQISVSGNTIVLSVAGIGVTYLTLS